MKVQTYTNFYTDMKKVGNITINNNVVNSGNDIIIDVFQKSAELKNEFEIYYNGIKKMNAFLPFINVFVNGRDDVSKLQQMKITDLNGNLKYVSSYNFIKNKIEEFIPYKYLITGSQKFNQFSFVNQNTGEIIDIFNEAENLFFDYIVIRSNNRYFKCYEVDDGHINHIVIYDDNIQIGELLKPNVVINGKDQYRIYLKEKYSFLSDSLSILALYVDRLRYNSSYLYNRSESAMRSNTYSDVNKYYNPNWVRQNFNVGSYYDDIENYFISVKQNVKNQFKKILLFIALGFAISGIIVLFILFKFY